MIKCENCGNNVFAFCFILQCLLLTATIYLVVPELNDLHGKSLACHSISLSLGFLLLALSQFHEMLLVEGTFVMMCIQTHIYGKTLICARCVNIYILHTMMWKSFNVFSLFSLSLFFFSYHTQVTSFNFSFSHASSGWLSCGLIFAFMLGIICREELSKRQRMIIFIWCITVCLLSDCQ